MLAATDTDYFRESPNAWNDSTDSDYARTLFAILGILLVAGPFFLGGRYAVGQLLYTTLAGSLAVVWTLRAVSRGRLRYHATGLELPLLVGVVIVVFQTVPLPSGILAWLAPARGDLLPMWQEDSLLGWHRWPCLSTAPAETVGGLVVLVSYGVVFVVVCQIARTIQDVRRVVLMVAASAAVMAVVGVVQYLSRTGYFLWLYEHPHRSPLHSATGAFDNHNHFAHLIALGIGPVIWWLARERTEPATRRTFRTHSAGWAGDNRADRLRHALSGPAAAVALLAVMLFAGFLSMSRGGLVAIGLAAAIASGGLLRLKMIRGHAVAALLCGGGLIVAALFIHGMDRVTEQVTELTSGSIEQLDSVGARRAVWNANLAAFRDHWLLGTGVGTHERVVNAYLETNFGVGFSHAESGYLQVASETGIVGLCVLASVLIVAARWIVRAFRRASSAEGRGLAVAVAASLIVSAVHSIWDFVWYIPATMMATVVLLACASRLASLTSDRLPNPTATDSDQQRHHRGRSASRRRVVPPATLAWLLAAAALTTTVMAVGNRLPSALASPAWDRYLRISAANSKASSAEALGSLASGENVFEARLLRFEAMLRHLRQVIEFDPRDATAHALYAKRLRARFEMESLRSANRMPLNQIVAAARASRFDSHEALDQWLSRAIGPSREMLYEATYHARCAVHLTPLETNAYLQLSDLIFLRGGDERLTDLLIDQAARVHPLHGEVLLYRATRLANEGRHEQVIELWQQAFAISPEYRRKFVELYAAHLPAQTFIEVFNPGLDVLRMLYFRYRQLDLEQQLATFRPYYAKRLVEKATSEPAETAAQLWLTAHHMYTEMEDSEKAEACCRKAAELRPYDFTIRRTFGRRLLLNHRFREAVEQLQWCADRRPGDTSLRRDLDQARTRQHAVATAVSLPTE